MEHAAILHVGMRADPDGMHVAAQHRIHPDAGILAENYISDDLRRLIHIRQRSSIVQPCSVTECPTVTYSPTNTPYCCFIPWSMLQSCTLECAPIRMECTSPRSTAFIQMLAFSPRTTSPMTCADSST